MIPVMTTNFTSRFLKHLLRSISDKYWNSTELSKSIWQVKDTNITPIVTWKVVAKLFSEIKITFINYV